MTFEENSASRIGAELVESAPLEIWIEGWLKDEELKPPADRGGFFFPV